MEALETRRLLTSGYLALNLVSDQAATALVQDANVVNPWGLALNSQGGDLWIANNGSSTASLYNGGVVGFGGPATPFGPDTPTISLPDGSAAGAAYNGSTSFFVSSGNAFGPASFLFAGVGGQISGYNRSVPSTPSSQAQLAATTTGASFTGLAVAFNSTQNQNLLYAADFQDNRIDVFDSSFNPVGTGSNFATTIPPLFTPPPGYAPYNIANIGGQLYVSYAMQSGGSDAAPAGGFIDVFDVNGNFQKQLIGSGNLNAPWGMAQAPASFGDYSGDLLVANHGTGTIGAFNPNTGAFLGALSLPSGAALTIDGLRGLTFGNGVSTGGASELFFSAGANDGTHGLVGVIQSAQGALLAAQGNVVTATAHQSFNGTLAVFSDAQNLSPGSFSGAINWGDGTSSTAGNIVSLAGGGFAVTGSHVYQFAGTKSISVQIRDSLGNSAAASAVAQVANAGVVVSGLTIAPTEGIAYSGAVATFIDGDGNTSTTPYQATIAWGDGGVSLGTVSFAGGTFTVAATHTYGDEGTQTATVTVTDSDASPTASANSIAKIADAPLFGTSAAISTTLNALFNGTVGSFTDANLQPPLSDFTATVDWGDGTLSAGIITAGVGQTFHIAASHIYLTSGVIPVTVTVNDVGGSKAVIVESASVVDIDVLSATLVELAPTQGSAFLGTVANVIDSNLATTAGQLAATIDWGDGTATAGTLSGAAGVFAVVGDHTYSGEGIYTLSAVIAHVGGTASASAAATITVTDVGSLAATGVAVVATEGAAFSGTVATVSDTFPAPASVFTATIDWGDGTQSPGTVSGANGQFAISGQHTYLEEGTYTPLVTIADLTPGTLSATTSLTATVLDAALSAENTTLHLTEHQTFAGTVAAFSDANPFATLADFTATIDWGDGTVTDGAVTGDGGFQVSGSHAYTLGGTYTATVTIHDGGGSTAIANSQVFVADYPLVALGAAIVGREGDLFSGVVATFTDTDPEGGRLGDFTATIDWGDGGVTSGSITGGAGQYTVSGAYAFADVSDQVVIVIHDAGGAAATVTVAASVADANTLTATGSALAGTEGQTISGVLATISDTYTGNPANDFSASVAWGDGATSAANVTGQNGQFTVDGSHVYAEAGSYTASILFSHNAPGTARTTAAATLTIADAPLTPTGVAIAATEGGTFTGKVAAFSDANLLSAAEDFTASINWGDGTPSTQGTVTLVAAGSFVVTGTHVYAEEAQHLSVTVAILDKGGSQVTANSTANVADAPLAAAAVTITATEGTPFTGTVATFTDGNPNATTADFTATINWGDGGTATAGTVSTVNGGFAVSGTHTYAEEAARLPITVTINDRGGSQATAFSAAIVADAPLAAGAITLTATQGIAFIGTVATFTDANSGASAGDFTASIDWGDGSTATGGSVNAAQGGGFIVSGAHTYTKVATRQVAVTIYDIGGSTASAASTAKIVDAPLVPGTPLTVTAQAGTSFSGTLGTFTDLDPNAALAQFSATINWGDGSTSPALLLAAPGQFIISGTHTYANPAAAQPITISVADIDGAKATLTAFAHVASTHFSASGATIATVEGTIYSGVVGTCADIDPNPAHYSATINWGDGTTTAATIATAPGGGFVINGNHAFTDSGSFSMSVVVANPSLDRLTVSSRANVGDAPLTPMGVTFTATEGTLFSGTVANFSDAGGGKASNFSATIDWQDGGISTGTITSIAGGMYAVLGSHTYAGETASLPVRVSISDVGGSKTTVTSTAVVADAPLALYPMTIAVPPDGVANALLLATFIDQGGAEPPGNYTATINWGDQTTATAGLITAAGSGFRITGNHQYLLPGAYAIQVLVRDQGGSSATTTAQATVSPSANQLYIEAAYNDILARPVDSNALLYWSGQLNGGQSRGVLAAALDHSAEYYANLIVTPAYQRYLSRAPDAAGLAFWVDLLQHHGLTDEQLEAGFISSPEFYARSGGSDKGWIDALYQTLLGRPADQAGQAYWLTQITSGVTRGQIAYSFTAGPERESQRITEDYAHYLDRQPDAEGLAYWLKQFAAGMNNEGLITGFVSSDEYFFRHAAANS